MSFRVTIMRPENTPAHYELCEKTITMRGDKKVTIHYFAPLQLNPTTTDFIIREDPRGEAPLEGQITLARELVQRVGLSVQEAARMTGELKAQVEGLGKEASERVITQILAAIE